MTSPAILPSDVTWTPVQGYEDIKYEKSADGIARVVINRPEVRNAFRPQTVAEMIRAFDDARDDGEVGVVVLTGEGPDAFCFLKSALNADCDGQAGLQDLAGSATLLYYLTEEGREGKEAFLEKRKPNFKKFRRYP